MIKYQFNQLACIGYFLLLVPFSGVFAHTIEGKNQVVHINRSSFEPSQLTITPGTTVTFENVDSVDHWPASNLHPTHEVYPEFDPQKPIIPGDSWSFTFNDNGEWFFHDHLFPEMGGKVIVEGEQSSSSTQGFITRIKYFLSSITSKIKRLTLKPILDSEPHASPAATTKSRTIDDSISEGNQEIFNNEEKLYSYIKKFGPKKTTQHLHELSLQYGDCHQPAHRAGNFAYEIYKEKAFQQCSVECHSGCYHGATEAYFKENGTNNLTEKISTICNSELNPFFSHQCVHGVGHGLMAWSNYDLHQALNSCDQLKSGQNSCWTGVFMENIVAGVASPIPTKQNQISVGLIPGHSTKYLNEDPHYPCNAIDEKYKNECYFLQTSRMMQLFPSNFQKISDACLKSPERYQATCFLSMGRDIGGLFAEDMSAIISACHKAPKGIFRTNCLKAAAQNFFWDPTGQDNAIGFCKQLNEREEKEACYKAIIEQGRDVLSGVDEKNSFCLKIEPSHPPPPPQTLKL
jgi:plastocyanin